MIMVDWKELANLGVGAVALVIILYIVNSFLKFQQSQNKTTNSTITENTKAINKLSSVLEKSSVQDEVFRNEIISLSEDTNRKVSEIHRKVV